MPATVGRFFGTCKQVRSRAGIAPGPPGSVTTDWSEIVLLKLPIARVEHKLRWEQSGSHGVFPHIYGDLKGADVHSSEQFDIADPSGWESVLKTAAFLE